MGDFISRSLWSLRQNGIWIVLPRRNSRLRVGTNSAEEHVILPGERRKEQLFIVRFSSRASSSSFLFFSSLPYGAFDNDDAKCTYTESGRNDTSVQP